jgi:hypothetical protein
MIVTASSKTSDGGFPSADSVQAVDDETGLNRAIQADRFFFPTISCAAIFKGNYAVGPIGNETFANLDRPLR